MLARLSWGAILRRMGLRSASTALRRSLRRRAAVRWGHDRLVAAQLAAHRLAERGPPAGGDLSDVTLVVKTFERPAALRRLLASVRRWAPGLAVLVVDDSRRPGAEPGVRTLALPYDRGLSAGRNAGLRATETPYFLLADDDFVLFRGTDLLGPLSVLRAHAELDIVGGVRIDLPLYRALPSAGRRPHGVRGELPTGTIGGLPRRAMVPNFFLGRTETVRDLGWDEELKLVEHSDFFGRALGVLTVVEDRRLRVLHARTLGDQKYMVHREDVADYESILRAKWTIPRGQRRG